MRILILTEASSAGVGRHVMDLAQGLIALGDEVHLAYSRRRIDSTFETRLAQTPELRTLVVDLRRGPHPSDMGGLRALNRYMQAHGPFDAVHAHSSKGGALARLMERSHGASVLYTPHCIFTMNPDLGRLPYLATRSVERALARRTDALVAVSPSEQEHLRDLGFEPARIHCIPNGVGEHHFELRGEARRRFALPTDRPLVGFLGRLSPQKDPLLMLRAFALLHKRVPEALLAMVGTGPLMDAARREAGALGIGPSVHWLGHQRAELIMPAFDVLCMSSLYEAMPYVLLEALSAGLPIVSTRVGGSRVAIEQGKNGVILTGRQPEEMASALEPLMTRPELRARWSAASRERVTRFSIEEMVRATRELYVRVARRPVFSQAQESA